jgi:Fe-coproporphyrin III synthase
MPSPVEMLKRQLNRTTHRIYTLPVVILSVTSRCNCRCLMCDIWQSGAGGPELTAEQLAPHLAAFEKLNVEHVVLSGGEPLLHRELWRLCSLLRGHGVAKITLLSAGLLLAQHRREVLRWCDAAIISLDGSRETHNRIRNVPRAYERLAEGVATLKAMDPAFPITARCVIQRRNFGELLRVIDAAHEIGLDGISFMLADTSSGAFNRPNGWTSERAAAVGLGPGDAVEFRRAIEELIVQCAGDLGSGFIAESADKLRRLAQAAAALHGDTDPPPVTCNAPWVSIAIEPDGAVRPCFFQRPVGNLSQRPLDQILNSERAVAFRRGLDVSRNPTCQRCVCTLNVGLRTDVLA